MDFTPRVSSSVRVRPKAESALAALQMRLGEGSGARALQRGEGGKEGPKEDLAVAAAAFIFQLIFLLSLICTAVFPKKCSIVPLH